VKNDQTINDSVERMWKGSVVTNFKELS